MSSPCQPEWSQPGLTMTTVGSPDLVKGGRVLRLGWRRIYSAPPRHCCTLSPNQHHADQLSNMSSTTTTVSVSTATTIHAIEPPKDADGTYGTIKFAEPDLSVGSDERSLFAVPATKAWETVCLPLHDFRTSPLLPHKGTLAGLDFAGFTVAHQDTKMQGEEWFDPAILKEVYFPEVEQFVKDLTGCKTVVCNNATFRRRLAKNQQDPHYYKKRDAPDAVDKMLETGKMTLNGPMSTFSIPLTGLRTALNGLHLPETHSIVHSC